MSASATTPPAGAAAAAGYFGRKVGSLSKERRWALVSAYVCLVFFAILFLAPPIYMLVTSLKTSAEAANPVGSPWLVRNPTLENYAALLGDPMFQRFFLNSVLVTVLVVALSMVVSTLAAFALARMKFWGSGVLATGVFLTYLVPDTLLFIPLYQIVGGLGLLNSIWGAGAGLPDADRALLHLDHDRLLRLHPEGAGRGGADRRRQLGADAVEDLHPGGAARHHRRDDLRLHRLLGRLRLPHRLHHHAGLDAADHRRRVATGAGRHLRLGADHGRLAAAALPPMVLYALLMDYYIAGLTAGATKG